MKPDPESEAEERKMANGDTKKMMYVFLLRERTSLVKSNHSQLEISDFGIGESNRGIAEEEAIIIIIDDAMQVDGNPLLPCYVTYVLFFCDANGYLTARPVSCACVCIHMHDTIWS